MSMTEHTLIIQPRDPVLLRDGRSFDAEPGAAARSLDWPLPRTIAGAIRTRIGEDLGFDWNSDGPTRAMKIVLAGALPLVQPTPGKPWQVYVPCPLDAARIKDSESGTVRWERLRPMTGETGGAVSDLPNGMRPLLIDSKQKSEAAAPLWSLESSVTWAANKASDAFEPQESSYCSSEIRTHVRIDPKTGTAAQGQLFTTELRPMPEEPFSGWRGDVTFEPGLALLCRVVMSEAWTVPGSYVALGGERVAARVTSANAFGVKWPTADTFKSLFPDKIAGDKLRLQIITPALFDGGWRPGWLGDDLTGSPPGLNGATLKLVGAAVGRPVAVSGWSLDKSGGKRQRAMPGRLAVPAGSVYFFEVISGQVNAEWLRQGFLAPVSDQVVDRESGFGLMLPSAWQ